MNDAKINELSNLTQKVKDEIVSKEEMSKFLDLLNELLGELKQNLKKEL